MGRKGQSQSHDLKTSNVKVFANCSDLDIHGLKSNCQTMWVNGKQDKVFCAPTVWLSMCCFKNAKNALGML